MKTILLFFIGYSSALFAINPIENGDSLTIEKIGGEVNEHIIDYTFNTKKECVQLSCLKKQYYIKILKNDNSVLTYPIDFLAKKIYQQPGGEIYLTDENQLFHVLFDPFQLVLVEKASDFLKKENDVIQRTDSTTIVKFYDYKTKTYGLEYIKGENERKILVYTNQELTKEELYRPEQIGKRTPNYNQLQESKMYNPLAPTSYRSTIKNYSGYKNVSSFSSSFEKVSPVDYSKKLMQKITYFEQDSMIYSFNEMNLTMLTYNLKSDSVNSFQLDLNTDQDFTIIYDEIEDQFYATFFEKGSLIIDKISNEDGSVQQEVKVSGVTFEKNIKICGNELYYTRLNESGFAKLYRVKL